jgi:hypothetical protein
LSFGFSTVECCIGSVSISSQTANFCRQTLKIVCGRLLSVSPPKKIRSKYNRSGHILANSSPNCLRPPGTELILEFYNCTHLEAMYVGTGRLFRPRPCHMYYYISVKVLCHLSKSSTANHFEGIEVLHSELGPL